MPHFIEPITRSSGGFKNWIHYSNKYINKMSAYRIKTMFSVLIEIRTSIVTIMMCSVLSISIILGEPFGETQTQSLLHFTASSLVYDGQLSVLSG